MPKLDAALVSFGKLIGLMDATGTVQWTWFADPLKGALNGVPQNRAEIGQLFRALLDTVPPDGPNQAFGDSGDFEWEPFKPTDKIGIGFVWNKDTSQPLHLDFGASASVDVGMKHLTLVLRAGLLRFDNASPHVDPGFGDVFLSSSFSMPLPFLKSASLGGSYLKDSSALKVDLTAVNTSDVSKKLSVPPTTFIAWDAVRMAAFIVRSWVRVKAAENPADKGFFYRLDAHLFPMLGDPQPNPIAALPPLDATGAAPNFNAWKDSVFTTAAGGAGALTFLWHLRALIMGNESSDLFTGSSFFPLVSGGVMPVTFPPASFPTDAMRVHPPVPDAPGVWVGIQPGPVMNSGDLVIEFRSGSPANVQSVVIVRFNNGALERPPAPAAGAFATLTAAITALVPIPLGAGNQITAATTADGFEIAVFTGKVMGSGVAALDGDYSFTFVLNDGAPIGYKIHGPIFDAAGLTLPPPIDPATLLDLGATLLEKLLRMILDVVLGTLDHPLTGAVNALLDLAKQAIKAGAPPSPDIIISTVAALAGVAGKFEAGPFELNIAANGALKPSIEIGPIAPEALKDAGISIGKIKAGTTLDLKNGGNPISGFSIGFTDVRLGKGGGASGLVAQLFPDLREAQGFSIAIEWNVGDPFPTITGGGKVPIQRSIGPLEIVALLVEFEKNSLTVGVDLFFQLGPITVIAYELGVKIPFNGGSVEPFLHGLGLSFDGGGIKLSGLFLEVPQGPGKPSDYVGGAVVSVLELFELSAIGGYSQDETGEASLFIFASLVAPLGGPPWFFITGIAGGFGFNRNLPSPELLSDHPFLRVMRGDIGFDSGNPQAALLSLGAAFGVSHGSYWIAAGIQFTCFSFINGKVVVVVQFGKKFSFALLGLLSYGISPVAYFELAFVVTADEEHFLLKAGLTPNSYIIDPDIFSLRGDFAMGVWYSEPHAGDFLVSIGGYHPFFTKPDHYPDLARVGCKALVYNFVHISVECFFACTPQALMAGASVSLWAEFSGIGAGLDVYLDVLINWDPFHILARLGVTVWFEFLGRHEIGVKLVVYTPPFGGSAEIDLAIVSFTVSFGAAANMLPPPKLHEFITRQLGVPAMPAGTGASVAAFNTDEKAGLFRIDFTEGRTTQPQEDTKKQEGLDEPVPLNSEFVFTVKTKFPIGEPTKDETVSPPSVLSGETDLPLCALTDLASTLEIKDLPMVAKARQRRLIDLFPAANFGAMLPAVQPDSTVRDAVSKIDTSKPSVPLSDGIEVSYRATFDPPEGTYLSGTNEEFSKPEEEYPLPLGFPKGIALVIRTTVSAAIYNGAALKTQIKPAIPHRSSREIAAVLNGAIQIRPIGIASRTAGITRITKAVRTFTMATPRGVNVIGVPLSPARRSELFPVKLGLAPVRAGAPQRKVAGIQRAVRSEPGEGERGVSIMPRVAAHLELTGSAAKSHRFTTTGKGWVRAIFLGGAEEFLGEVFMTAGRSHATPRRTRQMILLHEGTEAPLSTGARTPTRLHENIGAESDTTLIALGRRTFAAHGCVLQSATPLVFAPQLFDSVAGAMVLGSLTRFEVFLPAMAHAATLVLIVQPNSDAPRPAREQVRWAASNATLREILTVVAPDRTAFLMTADAAHAWSVEIDLGHDWRIAGVVLSVTPARTMMDFLRESADWDLIDDSLATGTRETPINVNLQLTR